MMTTDPRLIAVHESVHVGCPVEEAFALFTTGMGEWWPLDKASYGGDQAKDISWNHRWAGGSSSDSSTATSSRSAPSSLRANVAHHLHVDDGRLGGQTEVEVTFTPHENERESTYHTAASTASAQSEPSRREFAAAGPESCTLRPAK